MGKGKLKEVNFTPKTDLNEYLNGEVNFKIYKELSGETPYRDTLTQTEILNFFNLIYEKFEVIIKNKDRPLDVVNQLKTLKISDNKKIELFYYLENLLQEFITTQPIENKCTDIRIIMQLLLDEYINLLDKHLIKTGLPEGIVIDDSTYNIVDNEIELNEIHGFQNKIRHLIYIKAQCKKASINAGNLSFNGHKKFLKWCDLEIETLKELSSYEDLQPISQGSGFKFTERKGAKIDLIRILNAMYELKFVHNEDGELPTKKVFMEKAGDFFGTDLTTYDVNLSRAFGSGGAWEKNLEVFEKMKEITQKSAIDRHKK